MYLSDLFEGRGEKDQFDLVCVERLWIIIANGGYDDVLFTCDECSSSSFGSCSTHLKFPPVFCFRNSCSLLILEAK